MNIDLSSANKIFKHLAIWLWTMDFIDFLFESELLDSVICEHIVDIRVMEKGDLEAHFWSWALT